MQINWDKLSKYDEATQMAVSQIWNEYKYRHSHIWRITFQITTAVVALSVVPYLSGSNSAGILRFAPLFLASALAFFMLKRVVQEFKLFDSVKAEYIKVTRENDGEEEEDKHEFLRHTKSYLLTLAWGSVAHIVVLAIALLSKSFYSFLGFGFNL